MRTAAAGPETARRLGVPYNWPTRSEPEPNGPSAEMPRTRKWALISDLRHRTTGHNPCNGGMDMYEPKDNDRDLALIAQISAGDMAAMRALYMAHSEAVLRFVRTRIRDDFEANDIVHDTMLSVWRGASGFAGRSAVRSWILSLAKNKTIDHIRKQSRVTLAEPDDTVPDSDPNAEAVLAKSQDGKRVRECVEKLPDRQRSVVHLAFFEDLTYAEIARIEDVPEGTIKTRIFHAKKLLMRCLSKP